MAKKAEECKVVVKAPKAAHLVDVRVIEAYYDIKLERNVYYGEILSVSEERAKEIKEKGLVLILGDAARKK